MEFRDIVLFEDKTAENPMTFDRLIKEIYVTANAKKSVISTLISNAAVQVTTPTQVQLLGPVIAAYLDLDIKNDEQLIKLAQIIQRATSRATEASTPEGMLSQEERDQLLREAKKIGEALKKD